MYNNSYGFIDNQGQIVISCIYDRVSDFSNGLSLVNKDGVDFYIDKKGVKYTDNIKTLQMRQLKG